MLLPGSRFDLPFTCVDSTGLPTAPTGTPTGVLVQNGTDLGTTVTVTMTGAQGIASCTIPSSGVSAGDRFYIRISAVVSGATYVIPGKPESIANLAAIASQVRTELGTELGRVDTNIGSRAVPGSAMTLTSGERTTLAGVIEAGFLDDMTGGTFLAGIQAQVQALFDSGADVPVSTIASVVAAAVRTNLATELARIDVAISTRLSAAGYTTPPTAAANASQVRTELATELARIDAATSTRAVPGSAMSLTSGERTTLAGVIEVGFLDDMTGGTFLAGVQAQIQALFDSGADVPVSTIASVVAAAVRSNLATELSRIDATISSRLASVDYTAPPSLAGLATMDKANELLDAIEDLPGEILVEPANKLLTDESGYVTSTNGGLIMPLMTEAGNRVSALPLQLFTSEAMPITLTVKDRDGNAIDLTDLDLIFCMARPPASVRTLAELRSFELAVLSDDDWEELDVVSGLTGNELGQVTFPAPEFATKQAGPMSFSLRVNNTNEVKARGALMVQYAA